MCSLARWQSLAVLVHNWSRHNPPPPNTHTHTHTHTHTVPNTLTTTAILLHLSILSSFTLSRKRRLSYEVFSDRRPKRHLNTEWVRERDRERERERQRERGGQREKEVDPDWVYPFFLRWFETDLQCVCCPSHRQWDITPPLRLQRIWFKLDVHHSLRLALLCHDRMS